jgi:hypothetical protein
MHAIPMQSDQSRDKQLEALLALVFRGAGREFGRGGGARIGGGFDEVHEGMVQEHGVARGAVDYAIEDVGYDFALSFHQ